MRGEPIHSARQSAPLSEFVRRGWEFPSQLTNGGQGTPITGSAPPVHRDTLRGSIGFPVGTSPPHLSGPARSRFWGAIANEGWLSPPVRPILQPIQVPIREFLESVPKVSLTQSHRNAVALDLDVRIAFTVVAVHGGQFAGSSPRVAGRSREAIALNVLSPDAGPKPPGPP